MTLSSYLADWLAFRSSEIKPRTKESYVDLIDRLITPAVGSIDLDDLTSDDLRHLMAGILDAGHERTAELVFVLLNAALKSRCPAALADLHRPKHHQKRPKPWTEDQMAVYASACEDHRHGLCFMLALTVGLRRGEICGLRWKDVDFSASEFHIHSQRVRLATGELIDCSPKSQSSVRDIPIPSVILPWLKRARGHPEAYVCSITPSGLSHAHAKLVKRLDLPPLGLHGLRHSFATSSARHVGDIRSLQDILGHSSYAVTANIYLHPDHTMLSKAIDTPLSSWYNVIHK